MATWDAAVAESQDRVAYRLARKNNRLMIVNKVGLVFAVEDDKICVAVGQGQNKRYDDFRPFDVNSPGLGLTDFREGRLAYFLAFVNRPNHLTNGEAEIPHQVVISKQQKPKGLQEQITRINENLVAINEIMKEVWGNEQSPDLTNPNLKDLMHRVIMNATSVKDML